MWACKGKNTDTNVSEYNANMRLRCSSAQAEVRPEVSLEVQEGNQNTRKLQKDRSSALGTT